MGVIIRLGVDQLSCCLITVYWRIPRKIPKDYRDRDPGGKEFLVKVEWKVGDLTCRENEDNNNNNNNYNNNNNNYNNNNNGCSLFSFISKTFSEDQAVKKMLSF